MKIQFLNSQNVAAYRELRLQVLSNSPTACASSFKRETCLSLNDFAAWLQLDNNYTSSIFGAFYEREQLREMLGFSCEIGLPLTDSLKVTDLVSIFFKYIL